MATKTAGWACDFGCKRPLYRSKASALRHETACLLNPERKSCVTCEHDDTELIIGDEPCCALDKRPDDRACIVCCLWHKLKEGQYETT